MDIPAAQKIVAEAPESTSVDAPEHAGWVDHYAQLSSAEKLRFGEAVVELLLHGASDEKARAAAFWGPVTLPTELIDVVMAAFLANGRPDLGEILDRSWTAFSPSQAVAARAAYLANPARNLFLLSPALKADPDESVWAVVVDETKKTNDSATLSRLFMAAYRASKDDEFFALMKQKSEHVVRELANQLSFVSKPKLLAACGLS